ncbi:MAG: DMT family transporter [Sneathiellales bacterium]|nr:DMT family transporter [Sneathiellales bacterium]
MTGLTSSIGKGASLSLICLFLLGMMPVISSARAGESDALTFALSLSVWQVVFAFPLFLIEQQRNARTKTHSKTPARKARTAIVALITGSLFGLSTYLYILGIDKAGAVNAAIAIQAYPVIAILLEWIAFKRKKTPQELGLTVLLIGSLYYLATGGSLKISGLSYWLGVALLVPLLWSIAHIIIREELRNTAVTPIEITFARVLISTFLLALLLLVIRPEDFPEILTVILQPVTALMGLVYVLELIIWFYAVRHIDVSLASAITTPWPAVTMVLAIPFLGEEIEIYQITTLTVVILCIYGLILASLRKA